MKRIWAVILIVPCFLSALSFVEINNLPVPGVTFSSVDWGDFNNNGRLDLLITGDTGTGVPRFITRIYQNNGNNTFSHYEAVVLPAVAQGKAIWADFNNNGLLDIALCGTTTTDLSTLITKIYFNTGEGNFTESDIILPGIKNGTITTVDFNNDGFTDLFIAGESSTGAISRLYRNNGNQTFSLMTAFQFEDSMQGDAAFIDFNASGYPDLVLTGVNFARIYINNNGTGFTYRNQITLPNVRNGSVAWADYNNDGLPDLLITGIVGTIRITRVYKNIDGNSLVWQQDIALPGIRYGQAIWADINNNGSRDIIICGEATNGYITSVYLNGGNNSFTEVQNLNLTGLRYSSVKVSDVNNNGKPDLTIAGMAEGTQRTTKIYLNQINRINNTPLPPGIFNTAIEGNKARFEWNSGSDNETDNASLTYNIVLRQQNSHTLLISPHSNLQNGFRRINQQGNAGYRHFALFSGINTGFYEWAVQTIDSAGKGSAFSPWNRFEFMHKPENISVSRTAGHYHIAWDRVQQAASYRIYGSTNPLAENWTLLAEVTETRWLMPIQRDRYFFRVTAVRE